MNPIVLAVLVSLTVVAAYQAAHRLIKPALTRLHFLCLPGGVQWAEARAAAELKVPLLARDRAELVALIANHRRTSNIVSHW